jgi:hypothetical protein
MVLFWVAALACAIAEAAILWSVITQRSTPGAGASSPRAVEILWAVLPAIALGLVFVYTWRAIG